MLVWVWTVFDRGKLSTYWSLGGCFAAVWSHRCTDLYILHSNGRHKLHYSVVSRCCVLWVEQTKHPTELMTPVISCLLCCVSRKFHNHLHCDTHHSTMTPRGHVSLTMQMTINNSIQLICTLLFGKHFNSSLHFSNAVSHVGPLTRTKVTRCTLRHWRKWSIALCVVCVCGVPVSTIYQELPQWKRACSYSLFKKMFPNLSIHST